MRYSVPRKSRRVPLETEVHLKLEEVSDPVTESTRNISLGGLSVDIDKPAAVGSLVAFELQLGDSLIEGTGEVVWSREGEEAADRPAGMGIRFRYLSPGSRERIFRLVQWYANQEREVTAAEVAAAAAGGLPSPGLRRPGAPAEAERPPAGTAMESDPFRSAEDLSVAAAPAAGTALGGSEGEPAWPAPAPPLPTVEDLPELPRPIPEAPRSDAPAEPAWSLPETPAPELADAGSLGDVELPEAPGTSARPPSELSAEPSSPGRPAQLRGSAYSRSARLTEHFRRWVLPAAVLAAVAAAVVLFHQPVLQWLESRGEDRPPAREEVVEVPEETGGEEEATAPRRGAASAPDDTASAAGPAGEAAAGEGAVGGETAAGGGEPSSAAEPPPSPPADLPPLRNVERIAWQRGDDGTVVTIEGDGYLPVRSFASARLEGGNPRLLIRIRGVEKPYAQPIIRAGSPELDTIRTGLHLRPGGTELHVVLDLTSSDVEAASIEETGRGLRVRLARAGSP